jgi:FtsZ-binding cell division protein ZapB
VDHNKQEDKAKEIAGLRSVSSPVKTEAITRTDIYSTSRSLGGNIELTSAKRDIDAEVLTELISQRLEQLAIRAIQDALSSLAVTIQVKPLEDLAMTFAALILPSRERVSASQSVGAALKRAGIPIVLGYVYARAGSTVDKKTHLGECAEPLADDNFLHLWARMANVAYEGLAASDAYEELGFLRAKGATLKECASLAADTALLADALAMASLPDNFKDFIDRIEGLILNKGPAPLVDAIIASCTPLGLILDPAALTVKGVSSAQYDHVNGVSRELMNLRLSETPAIKQGLKSTADELLTVGARLSLVKKELEDAKKDPGTVSAERQAELQQEITKLEKQQKNVKVSMATWQSKVAAIRECSDSLGDYRQAYNSLVTFLPPGLRARANNGSVKQMFDALSGVKELLDVVKSAASDKPGDGISSPQEHIAFLLMTDPDASYPALCELDENELEAKFEAARGDLPGRDKVLGDLLELMDRLRSRDTAFTRKDIMLLANMTQRLLFAVRAQYGAFPDCSVDGDDDAPDVEVLAWEIMNAVLSVIPEAVIEQEQTLTLDAPLLTSAIATRYNEFSRGGWYIRATIGLGYALSADTNFSDAMGTEDTDVEFALGGVQSALYEEVGFGYRQALRNEDFLFGFDVVGSGLLYNLILDDEIPLDAFVGAGPTLQTYGLLDVSLKVGGGYDSDEGWSPVLFLGVQVPLQDYLEALRANRKGE